jgi:ribosomal 50S subunit-recycling heat shock protein
MRLDKYLKVSRIIKRREMAKEACDGGLVSVNGRAAKASKILEVGDELALNFPKRKVTLLVKSLNAKTTKDNAESMYEIR